MFAHIFDPMYGQSETVKVFGPMFVTKFDVLKCHWTQLQWLAKLFLNCVLLCQSVYVISMMNFNYFLNFFAFIMQFRSAGLCIESI